MTLTTLMQRLEQTGTRLDSLENAVAAIRGRLRFWRNAALISGAVAIVLFLAWRNAHRRLAQYEKRNQIAP